MSPELIMWLLIAIAAIVVELLTVGFVSLWFALGAGGAIIAMVLGAPIWLQFVVFVLVSILGIIAFRGFWKKKIKENITATNFDRNIGKVVLVTEKIDNLEGTGEVKVNGQRWTAISESDDIIIPIGTHVVIKAIEGSKLLVNLPGK